MTRATTHAKIEYGDFQTPLPLARAVCKKLLNLGISPDVILEPTCGVGHFIQASGEIFHTPHKIIGVEINVCYLETLRKNDRPQNPKVETIHGDFFKLDWNALVNQCQGEILVLGNFPWVTNSTQGTLGSLNLPQKSNFQNYTGLDAMTGKSNFDISEWMLIQVIHWLQNRTGSLAMLCKTSVARKLLNYIHARNLKLAHCATYKIDTRSHFDALVDACLLVCRFDLVSKNHCCDVFEDLETSQSYRIGYKNSVLVKDIDQFESLSDLYDSSSKTKWRSGIKHDCAAVMEFRKIEHQLINGFGEAVDIEDTYLFPLLKGSDVAQGRVKRSDRYVLVPQRFVGEPTESIQSIAPKTWHYLQSHSQDLDRRKSKVYQNSPRFSIFGVGAYTFEPWKIAICGLYKKLEFQLIGAIDGKPVMVDDTVYFLHFNNEKIARQALECLTSPSAFHFYSSLIFWDEKRPIKSSILNRLNLTALEKMKLQPRLHRSLF